MPSKVTVKLKLEKPVKGTEIKPDILHGLFFNLLDPQTAKQLHDEYGNIRPYALFCRESFVDEPFEEIHFEMNLLEDKYLAPLLSSLLLEKERPLFLGKVGIKGVKVSRVREEDITPYGEIVEKSGESPKVFLKFLKPTTFRRNDIDLPFPLPELVFKGLVKKWNTFSPIPVGVDLRPFYNLIKVSKYSLRTYKVEFSKAGKLTAFWGYAIYDLSEVKHNDARRWFSVLLNFARWSGIGRKTTMGLGKVLTETILENDQGQKRNVKRGGSD